ncbi:interferon-inducible GTPase-domain-containing protein [Jimgerdemannia flammicorona]|uniref:Interferon-inducible GTPase-domain-containing protein n=1 Tax=Jimgerdemannia flammicorona TaxID=994334 RepID=A0A433BHT6_9FUNG|nr:interferon-inducible GTPase-domain-containing protein [Jimgerdemannia flammicorona]
MGNEPSKQKTLNEKASRVAKGAGAAGGALVASPLVIIASPLYLGPQHFIEQNTTGLGIVPNAVAGLVAGALAAPFLPLVLPFMAAKQALNGASGQEKSSPVGDYIAASVAANEAFNTVPPRSVVSQGASEEVREYFGMDCDNCYNIAIVGGSEQGKSSLINGLMGVRDGDDNAASVGEDETAFGIKSYQHPNLNTLVLWDLPGGGAERNPGEPYFPDKMMFAFDALIVVTSAKFLQIELDIAKQANEKRVPIYFVRSKADQSIESKLRKNSKMPWEQAAMELQKEVHKNIRGQIEATGLELDKLFILSAWHLQELVELMVKSKEPSATLHLMDEFRLVDMLIKETISYRSAAS